jgi:Photosynthesis system II assembly factor YCF48
MSDVPSRLLRETLREQLTPPPSSGCLDADLLAAWSDGKLNRRERAMAESHAAACARCQAILAAMAKTAAPPPARKWWQAQTVRWLVPIAASSALAVVVWMNVPAGRHAATPARSDRPASAVVAPAVEPRPAKVAPLTAKDARTLERADTKRREQPAARADVRSAPAASADIAPSAPKPPEPSATQAAPPSAVQKEEAAAQTFRSREASAAPAAAQSPLRSAAAGLAETVTISPPQTVTGTSRAFFAIQSPNQSVRWRIVAGTTVERSTDAGATWQVQSTDATVRLVAGAAPSPTICWIVGAGGIVLVTRDGRTWQRVAFPEAIDLVAIRATDGSTAAATTADGRLFSTADGGKTWRSP